MRLLIAAVLLAGCGASHDVPASSCHGLSLGDCRVTPGCVADECPGCDCAVAYRGCLAASETPAMCPALGCPSGVCCSSELACTSGICGAPGTTNGCGACNTAPGDCTTDADCKPRGATLVCDPIACSCQAARACAAGCADDTACGEGARCDVASARCVALACSDDAGCPGDFHCVSHACERRSCTDDLACDGYCVAGACYAERGECFAPVP